MQKSILYVVKIGGNIIDNPATLNHFLDDFAKINSPKILIHGGGKIATEIGEKLGLKANMIDGRRITDKDTIDLVTMVYGGLINKNIVGKLQAKGQNAIGLTGADAATIIAEKRPVAAIDYGFVGDIKSINSKIICNFLEINLVPIFAPLTSEKSGQILNTNADTMANEIAIGLSGNYLVNLVYCFERIGVLTDIEDENSFIKSLNYAQYQQYKLSGAINKGMIPKLDNAFTAIQAGVEQVIICHADNLKTIGTSNQIGTKIIK